MEGSQMDLIPVRKINEMKKRGEVGADLPTTATSYKWHHEKKHPGLYVKLPTGLFLDLGAWEAIKESAKNAQVVAAKKVRSGLATV